MRRLLVFVAAIGLLSNFFGGVALACDEDRTNVYVDQVLFGVAASSHANDESLEILHGALYLCCEQSDNAGQDKIDFLKSQRVSGVPALGALNISSSSLLECSHNSWEHKYPLAQKAQNNRRKVLQNAVNKVCDFGLINNLFGRSSGKCDSFAAMLYYVHLLSDHIADAPSETEIPVGGRVLPAYSGQPYVEVNGGQPSFTPTQKRSAESFVSYSSLDEHGRAGAVFACIGPSVNEDQEGRNNIQGIKPTGWSYDKYEEFVTTRPAYVYNRCHLLAHMLGGEGSEENLVTGTRYLNVNGMLPFENEVRNYIKETDNHVLYRVTPVFRGDNLLVSGVQIEAYSIEDGGNGVSFNVYCYNVQPGVDLNYTDGSNTASDTVFGEEGALPFAVYNASSSNPDLMFEMRRCLEVLFEDQKDSELYDSMMREIDSIAKQAREKCGYGETTSQCYVALIDYEYQYLKVLEDYVPILLEKEDFFKPLLRNSGMRNAA